MVFTSYYLLNVHLFEWQFAYILQVYYALYDVLSYDELPFHKVAFPAHSAKHEKQQKKKWWKMAKSSMFIHWWEFAGIYTMIKCYVLYIWKYYIFMCLKKLPPVQRGTNNQWHQTFAGLGININVFYSVNKNINLP